MSLLWGVHFVCCSQHVRGMICFSCAVFVVVWLTSNLYASFRTIHLKLFRRKMKKWISLLRTCMLLLHATSFLVVSTNDASGQCLQGFHFSNVPTPMFSAQCTLLYKWTSLFQSIIVFHKVHYFEKLLCVHSCLSQQLIPLMNFSSCCKIWRMILYIMA